MLYYQPSIFTLPFPGGPQKFRGGGRYKGGTWDWGGRFEVSDLSLGSQFLVQLKIMDYSLLLGIHDIVRGSEPEEEGPVREEESEGDGDCGLTGPPALVGSYGTSPEGIGSYMLSHRPLGPGEFESFIDVYAIRSAEGKRDPGNFKGGEGSPCRTETGVLVGEAG